MRADMKVLIENKKSRFRYFFHEKLEVGIMLNGYEVKSLREKHGSIDGAYALVLDDELWLVNITKKGRSVPGGAVTVIEKETRNLDHFQPQELQHQE